MDANKDKINHRDTEDPETSKTFLVVSLLGLCVFVVNFFIYSCPFARLLAFICVYLRSSAVKFSGLLG
jgi:hypothetical protein